MIGKIIFKEKNGEIIKEIPLNPKKRVHRKRFFDIAYIDDFRDIMNTSYFQESKELVCQLSIFSGKLTLP